MMKNVHSQPAYKNDTLSETDVNMLADLTREYGRLLHGCGSTNWPILQQTMAKRHVLGSAALEGIA